MALLIGRAYNNALYWEAYGCLWAGQAAFLLAKNVALYWYEILFLVLQTGRSLLVKHMVLCWQRMMNLFTEEKIWLFIHRARAFYRNA
jgi:hypothetical protein